MSYLKIGSNTVRAIPRDIQYDPVKDVPLHIDFMRVTKDSRLTVAVPIDFINEEESPGLKRGGVLNIVLHEIELSCPPETIPEHLVVDLSGLEIHDTIHLEQLDLPEGVVPVAAERDNTIATIVAPSRVRAEAAE